MKIIEVRDGFINFEADSSIYLSTFVQAEGTDKNYIAQVNKIHKVGDVCIASAKILFVLIDNQLHSYDRTQPPKDSEISLFCFKLLQDTISVKAPVIVGKSLDNSENIVIDSSSFNKKMLISVDNPEMNNLIIRNLSKQFENLGINSVIIDALGVIKAKKYAPGADFKLPINKSTLAFIYQSCLKEATADSKSLITEIFKDLSEYAETVPFVPFQTLKTIVDDMVDKQHVFKLFVLKNKLAKLEKLGYFATNKDEVQNIDKILDLKLAIIDISKTDTRFQNYFLDYIYAKLENKNSQVFLETSNTLSKNSLKTAIVTSKASTAVIAHSHFHYLNDIKNLFDNFILEASLANKSLFKIYNTFFDSMSKEMYLVAGEGFNYIPLACKAQVIDDLVEAKDFISDEIQTEYIEEQNEIVEEPQIEPESQVANQIEQDAEIDEEESSGVEDLAETADEEVLEEEDVTEVETISREELIHNIDEKSENAINAVSDNIEETEEIDLFDDEEIEEDPEDNSEQGTEDLQEISDVEQEEQDFIEPEYTELETVELENEGIEVELTENDSDELDVEQQYLEERILESEENSIDETEIISENIEPDDIFTDADSEENTLEEYGDESSELKLSDLNDEAAIQDSIADTQDESDLNEADEELALQLDENDEALLQDIQEDTSDIEPVEEFQAEQEETQIISVDNNDEFQNLDEIVELDSSEGSNDAILVDITDENEDIVIDEEQDRQIIEDVDKVYTTIKNSDDLEEISDSDLDLIDQLNSDDNLMEEISDSTEDFPDSGIEEGILEQPQENVIPQRQGGSSGSEILEKRDANTPIVPVYDADIPQEDMVVSDSIQQGDSVIHAKYGNGIVEKMIKYGNKTLFSINFDNIGRRLLDPTLTEIKKV